MSQQNSTVDTSNITTGNDYETPAQTNGNVDLESLESEWVDEEDDDDMDFDPVANSSDQDADFLDPSEEAEAEFHGMGLISRLTHNFYSTKTVTDHEYHARQTPRMDWLALR